MTNEIQKSISSLEATMKEGLEKKRPLEGPPPSEAKKIKFQPPGDERGAYRHGKGTWPEDGPVVGWDRCKFNSQWYQPSWEPFTTSGTSDDGTPVGTPVTPMHVPIDSASGVPVHKVGPKTSYT